MTWGAVLAWWSEAQEGTNGHEDLPVRPGEETAWTLARRRTGDDSPRRTRFRQDTWTRHLEIKQKSHLFCPKS